VSKKQDYSSFNAGKYPNTAEVTVEVKGAGGESFSNVTVIFKRQRPSIKVGSEQATGRNQHNCANLLTMKAKQR
jgi:hypothetical protein